MDPETTPKDVKTGVSDVRLNSLTPRGRGSATCEYIVRHSTPGARGTTLEQTLKLSVDSGSAAVSMDTTECEAETADEALDRFAIWLQRLAIAIEGRDRSRTLPL